MADDYANDNFYPKRLDLPKYDFSKSGFDILSNHVDFSNLHVPHMTDYASLTALRPSEFKDSACCYEMLEAAS